MNNRTARRDTVSLLLIAVLAGCLSGCASLISSATSRFADNLTLAVLNQDDPPTVRDGAPAYLLLLDSLIEGSPDSPDLLQAGASLYAAYGSVFVAEPERARKLTARARSYGKRALCAQHEPSCGWDDLRYEAWPAQVAKLGDRDAKVTYAYVISWLAYIRAHSDDWNALADLPKVELVLNRLNDMDSAYEQGNIHLYLGILNTLRPPALGGRPEVGREHFELAIQLSNGRDLSAKVEYARGYARLVYERELHDRLLREVLEADPSAPALTLLNVLAQEQARELLASADDYF